MEALVLVVLLLASVLRYGGPFVLGLLPLISERCSFSQ